MSLLIGLSLEQTALDHGVKVGVEVFNRKPKEALPTYGDFSMLMPHLLPKSIPNTIMAMAYPFNALMFQVPALLRIVAPELAGAGIRKAAVMDPGDIGAEDLITSPPPPNMAVHLQEATAVAGGGTVDDVNCSPGRRPKGLCLPREALAGSRSQPSERTWRHSPPGLRRGMTLKMSS